jgi:hypothetical protein
MVMDPISSDITFDYPSLKPTQIPVEAKTLDFEIETVLKISGSRQGC